MNKFFLKVLLTVVFPVLFLLLGYEKVMRSIPNDYSQKSHLWEEKVDSIQVLILGSSHCYYAFNPVYFDKYTYNAAHVSQSYNYDWFILDKYIDRMNSLEFVVLPLTIISPNQILEYGEEAWRCVDYSVHYKCRVHHWWEFKMRYYFSYLSLPNVLRALNRIRNSNYNDIHIDENGYSQKTIADQVEDLDKSGKLRAEAHRYGRDFTMNYGRNINYLNKIIRRCNEKGVRVVLVTTPAVQSYYSYLSKEQIDTINVLGKEMNERENVKYINLLNSSLFNKNDFFDADHLCNNGAEKISKQINDIINKWK